MTKEQYDKATKINKKIKKYEDLLTEIKDALTIKITKDSVAKETLKERGDDRNARWQLLHFFKLRFEKKKLIVIPHYEFAQGIEMDAEPELIAVIIDYWEKKKKAYEAEFEQIGDEEHDRAQNAAD